MFKNNIMIIIQLIKLNRVLYIRTFGNKFYSYFNIIFTGILSFTPVILFYYIGKNIIIPLSVIIYFYLITLPINYRISSKTLLQKNLLLIFPLHSFRRIIIPILSTISNPEVFFSLLSSFILITVIGDPVPIKIIEYLFFLLFISNTISWARLIFDISKKIGEAIKSIVVVSLIGLGMSGGLFYTMFEKFYFFSNILLNIIVVVLLFITLATCWLIIYQLDHIRYPESYYLN